MISDNHRDKKFYKLIFGLFDNKKKITKKKINAQKKKNREV